MELALGCLLLAFPQAFEIRLYPEQLHRLSRTSILFLSGGILTLLSHAVGARRPGIIPIGLAALGTLPLLIVAGVSARADVWAVAVMMSLLALGVYADVTGVLKRTLRGRMTTLAVVIAVASCAIGVMALLAPHLLHTTILHAVAGRARLLGAGMLAASASLLLGGLVPHLSGTTRIAAALPLWALAVGFIGVQGWAGVLTYGLLGSALAFEPALTDLLERRAADRGRQSSRASAYELSTEAVAWGFALLMGLVGSIDALPERRLAQAMLVLCTSVFTMVWYHFVPVGNTGQRHTLIATAVYSFLGVVLVQLTGGARSPYFFVYFLPVIALAWTQNPHLIVVPLAIPLAALLAEIALGLRAGLGGLTPLTGTDNAPFIALPQAAGLVLIAGFTYFLARRNVENSQRLREARRQFEAVLTHMADGLVTTDSEGRVTLCNPAALELLGGTPADAQGRRLIETLPMRRADGTTLRPEAHPVSRALAGERVTWERLVIERPEGSRTLAVAATPLAATNGSRGAIVMLRDVRAEIEMERMRDDFFFIASHELRTPLTVTRGNLELALESSPPAPLRRALEEALASTTRLIRMVNDFLDAARLEHGAVSLRMEDEQLPALVQQAVETLTRDAARKSLTITYRPPRGLPAVRMDVERTLQILFNLIGNGIRYTQHGGIEITHAVDGLVVETVVRDTGIGIAPEHHDRLFARFGQVERGLTRAAGGSGLGLYISRKLAEQMGGTVVLKSSAAGQGSAFALRLPVAGVPAAAR